MLPTPTARDWRSGKASDATMARNARPLSEHVGGLLNPTWVEWLMGWPLKWTAVEPMEAGTMDDWRGTSSHDWWASEPYGVPRVANGVHRRVPRLEALGNGQVPACVVLAWETLAR